MKKLSLVVLCLALASSVMVGQLRKGAMGVTGGVGSSNTLGVAYAMSENMRLGIDLVFSSASTTTTLTAGDDKDTQSDLGVGLSAKFYMATAENLSTYVGGAVGFESVSVENMPPGGVTTKYSASGFQIGAMYGAEYWFSSKFSWYGHVGLGYSSLSSDGPPKISSSLISTSYGTGLTWYL